VQRVLALADKANGAVFARLAAGGGAAAAVPPELAYGAAAADSGAEGAWERYGHGREGGIGEFGGGPTQATAATSGYVAGGAAGCGRGGGGVGVGAGTPSGGPAGDGCAAGTAAGGQTQPGGQRGPSGACPESVGPCGYPPGPSMVWQGPAGVSGGGGNELGVVRERAMGAGRGGGGHGRAPGPAGAGSVADPG